MARQMSFFQLIQRRIDRRGRKGRNHVASRKLRLEQLDKRELLATDVVDSSLWHNANEPADVNADGHVAPADALLLINVFNSDAAISVGGMPEGEQAESDGYYYDVNGDTVLTLDDLAAVLVQLSVSSSGDTQTTTSDATLSSAPSPATTGPTGTSPSGTTTTTTSPTGTTSGTYPTSTPPTGTYPTGTTSPEGTTPTGTTSTGTTPTGTTDPGSGTTPTSDPTMPPAGPTEPAPTSDPGSGPTEEPSAGADPSATEAGFPPLTCQEEGDFDEATSQCPQPRPDLCPNPPQVSITGGTVNEGSLFVPLSLERGDCLVSYTVDWGDGTKDDYIIDHPFGARHVYTDDGPTPGNGTSSDEYTITITLLASDGETATASATVTVKNVAPVANKDTFQMNEDDNHLVGNLLMNDTDVGVFDEKKLVSVNTENTRGKVTFQEDGSFTYQPAREENCLAEGQSSMDTFSYTVRDDDNGEATGTVNIEIIGQREVLFVSFNGDGAKEDGEVPARAHFRMLPSYECGRVGIGYAPANPALFAFYGYEPDQIASVSDIRNPTGAVVFEPGMTDASVDIIPVDDTIIERTERFGFTTTGFTTNEYEVRVLDQFSFVIIEDDEWRFVEENRSRTATVGPEVVEAFSRSYQTALLNGLFIYSASIFPNLNTQSNSTALATADVRGRMTYARQTGTVDHRSGAAFECNSQTGDVWHTAIMDGGHTGNSSLLAGSFMDVAFTDDGAEGLISVAFHSKLLASGTMSSSRKGSVTANLGAQGKGALGGTIELTFTTTSEGGDTFQDAELFNFKCQRGE